jgi:regulator of nucleoside diphosphate kinase
MHATINGERMLTELDHIRLSRFPGGELPPALTDLLATAEIVHAYDIPVDVVTMYSRVDVVDVHTLRGQRLTICYPADAKPDTGHISVFSPVGCSLLGLKVGAVARWQTPGGEDATAKVLAISFQPEASGDYLT